MQRILVVEDDWEMNQGICFVLKENGYDTVSAHSIGEGRKAYEENGAVLVLLDVNLPDGEGFEFCEWLRVRSSVPVLFLTARDLEEDVLKGYEMGAEVKGQICPVTPTEFRILQEFLSHKGQLLTYEVLLDRLWDSGSQFVDRHALAVNINRLRGKIEDKEHRYISNVYGMGYQWIGQ